MDREEYTRRKLQGLQHYYMSSHLSTCSCVRCVGLWHWRMRQETKVSNVKQPSTDKD